MLSDRCLSVCPVYDVGALWPNGWTDQDETCCEINDDMMTMTMLDHKLNPIILLLLTSYSRSAALPLSISLPFCLTVIIDCHQTKPTKNSKKNKLKFPQIKL